MNNQSVHDVQMKILETMKFIDSICREHHITYYIMGGTALGAIRHKGFIPWDDDLDIFMTPQEYNKFKKVLNELKSELFVLQEWKTTPGFVEYAKVRMNGTTFIEDHFKDRKDMHHGIYVDIMMLHKVPNNIVIQKWNYVLSKFVTLYGLSQRNWVPKSTAQNVILKSLNLLPCKWLSKVAYSQIYKYDNLNQDFKYCYWITPAKFKQGLFDAKFFSSPVDIVFEDTKLYASANIKEYLSYRYGDYMKLPSKEAQKAAVHAMYYDVNKDYTEYFKNN